MYGIRLKDYYHPYKTAKIVDYPQQTNKYNRDESNNYHSTITRKVLTILFNKGDFIRPKLLKPGNRDDGNYN